MEAKPIVLYDGELVTALKPIQSNWSSFQVHLGYTDLFHIPAVTSVTSRIVRDFLETLCNSVKQIKASYLFDCEQGIALHTMQGKRASSLSEGEVSWFFSTCDGNLASILE